MQTRILVIDDDEKLNQLLTTYLANHGFEVISSTLPEEGLRLVEREKPGLVLRDVMLVLRDVLCHVHA